MAEELKIEFETIKSDRSAYLSRSKVPGGWLVMCSEDVQTNNPTSYLYGSGYEWRSSICFIPDPDHTWLVPAPEEPPEIPRSDKPFLITQELYQKYYGDSSSRLDEVTHLVYEHRVLEFTGCRDGAHYFMDTGKRDFSSPYFVKVTRLNW